MTALEFHDVRVRDILDGVSLTVAEGSVVGLVGESGCGKTTLAKAAVGLVPLTSGRIFPDKKVQLIFQDPYSSLDPRMTIGAAIAEAGRNVDVPKFLDLVGLDADLAQRLPRNLSGGQRQRVAIARALAARPEVVIADEITSALDVSVQGMVLNLIRDLRRELGLTMLFISHNLAVIRFVSDRVAVMHQGRIVEEAPVDELMANPADPYTRTLLDSIPRLR